jgi:hypothetical protein
MLLFIDNLSTAVATAVATTIKIVITRLIEYRIICLLKKGCKKICIKLKNTGIFVKKLDFFCFPNEGKVCSVNSIACFSSCHYFSLKSKDLISIQNIKQ